MRPSQNSLRQRFTQLGTAVIVLAASTSQAADSPQFHWVDGPRQGSTDLHYGDQPVLRYMHAFDTSNKQRTHETYKVFHHVFGPGSDQIITKGPGGLYTHHRGLFVGWNQTSFDGGMLDFWHCKQGAHLRHVKFLEKRGDGESGRMTALIHWNDAEGKPVIIETRTLHVTTSARDNGNGTGWQIDWSTSLAGNRGRIRLDGDRQHAGFQFRAAQPVAEAKGARYIRPAGFPTQLQAYEVGDQENPPRHVDLGWLAMTYTLAGKSYTIEYFEDPSLPRPSRYSERPYGRFGAFFKATIEPDQPLEMRYRVRVTPGSAPTQHSIQKRYNAFVAELEKQ